MTTFYGYDNWNDYYDHQSTWYYDNYYGWYEWADSLTAYGYSGNDYLAGDMNADTIYGGAGSDTLYGEEGNDYLDAGSWSYNYWDYNYSNSDSYGDYNYLDGGSGSDTLQGGAGYDTLVGSTSTAYDSGEFDILSGGGGMDTFVLGQSWGYPYSYQGWGNSYQGSGHATITDFNGLEDYIQVSGSSSTISLGYGNVSGSFALDTLIQTYSGDLLAVIQDNTDVNFGRDFIFV